MEQQKLENTMKVPVRVFRLFMGLFICAVALVFGIYSELGLSPWNVFADGVREIFGITMGRSQQYIGFVILLIDYVVREPIGLGSIANMICVGAFLDMVMVLGVIPIPATDNHVMRWIYLLLSMVLYGIGTYYYLGAGYGAGPRDGLMVALIKKFKRFKVGTVKAANDVVVTVVGWMFGGLVGLGTLVSAFFTGYIMDFVHKLYKFEIKKVKHETAIETINIIFKKKEAKVEEVENPTAPANKI